MSHGILKRKNEPKAKDLQATIPSVGPANPPHMELFASIKPCPEKASESLDRTAISKARRMALICFEERRLLSPISGINSDYYNDCFILNLFL